MYLKPFFEVKYVFFWCIDYCRQNHNFHMCSIMNIVELKQNVTWHIFKSVYCTFIRAPKRGKTITSKTMNQIGSLYFSAACFSRAYLTHWFHTNLSLLLPLPQSLPPSLYILLILVADWEIWYTALFNTGPQSSLAASFAYFGTVFLCVWNERVSLFFRHSTLYNYQQRQLHT